jgi:hypothetical protein
MEALEVFERLKRSGGLRDSPLERGVGVCFAIRLNTLPPPHPLSRGEFYCILKSFEQY